MSVIQANRARGGEYMAVRKARKKVARKAGKKTAKRKIVKKKAAPKKRVRASAAKAKPKSKPKAKYTCVLCGVEVGITREGLGISRLMCCGHPMRKK
jgi:ribosomal protein S14